MLVWLLATPRSRNIFLIPSVFRIFFFVFLSGFGFTCSVLPVYILEGSTTCSVSSKPACHLYILEGKTGFLVQLDSTSPGFPCAQQWCDILVSHNRTWLVSVYSGFFHYLRVNSIPNLSSCIFWVLVAPCSDSYDCSRRSFAWVGFCQSFSGSPKPQTGHPQPLAPTCSGSTILSWFLVLR